jgi:hypothetical protein
MGVYSDWQSKLAPPWLRRANGSIIETTYGAEKDVQLDRANQALLAGVPGQGPADAIDIIGGERQLPRKKLGETDQDYVERLRAAWSSPAGFSRGGTHGGLLRALQRAGFPMGDPDGCHVVQRTKRYSYLSGSTVVYGTHSGMTWDSSPASIWNQFAIIFGADVPGLTDGSDLADELNRIVRLWKPAKARFMGTYVVVTAPVWGWPPSTKWGDPGLKWGDGSSRFISPGTA